MVDAIETQGSKFEIRTATGPEVFTRVKGIVSFNAFDGQASEIDVTTLDSTAKEFLMGLQDFGNFGLESNYLPDDAGQQAMREAKASREIQRFKFTFKDGSTATFDGYVMSAPISGGVDAKVDGGFTVRISGDVAFAEAP